ncbi:MAG: LmeA family phospholipid-binding protein [Candidatus Gastranaerophilaceae bacterium]
MKKLVLIFVLMVFCSTQAFAVCDYSAMCASKAYDLSSRGCQVTSRVTGMTFLAEKIAQSIIKRELRKETKEKFNVEMKSYSANDLLHGRFKSLKISGKNLEIDGVYLSSFEAKTLCDFNYVELNKKTLKFRENMAMEFSIVISDTDLRKTIQSVGYLDMLNKVNLSGMGITFFKLSGADVRLKNNKLYFTIKVTSPISAKPLDIVVRSDLKVEDGNIVMTKVDFANLFTVIDLSKAAYLLNALNPLTFSTEILNNKNSEMSVKSVDIIGDKVFIKGTVFIPKNTTK